jgi:NADH-quinone oxidoreductase subunit C
MISLGKMAKILTTFVPSQIPEAQTPAQEKVTVDLDALVSKIKKTCGETSVQSIHKEHKGDPFLVIENKSLHDVVQFLRDDPDCSYIYPQVISATDFLPTQKEGNTVPGRIEVCYVLFSFKNKHQISLKVYLDRSAPEVESISDLYRAANWYERECFDMVGVNFKAHPYLKRLLLPEDWVGYPLKRDYIFPQEYNGMKVPL